MPLSLQDEYLQLIAFRDRVLGLMTFNLILIELLAFFFFFFDSQGILENSGGLRQAFSFQCSWIFCAIHIALKHKFLKRRLQYLELVSTDFRVISLFLVGKGVGIK